MTEPTPSDLLAAMERIRKRLEGELSVALDSKSQAARRLAQIEVEMVAADRAMDFYRKGGR